MAGRDACQHVQVAEGAAAESPDAEAPQGDDVAVRRAPGNVNAQSRHCVDELARAVARFGDFQILGEISPFVLRGVAAAPLTRPSLAPQQVDGALAGRLVDFEPGAACVPRPWSSRRREAVDAPGFARKRMRP